MDGYGLRACGKAILDLIGFGGDKALKDKAKKVHRTLADSAVRNAILAKQSLAVLVPRIIERCQKYGDRWALAASAQLAQIRGISIDNARAIVSEFSDRSTY